MVDEGNTLSPFGSFLFPHIFRSFRMAIQPCRLAIAFAALTLIWLTGWLMDLGRTVVDSTPTEDAGNAVFQSLWGFADAELQTMATSILAFDIRHFGSSLVNTLHRWVEAVTWLFRHHPVQSIILLGVALITLSAAGGAICRMTAVEFTRGERLGLGRAWRFATRRLANLAVTPIVPLVIALLLGLPIILLGALGNIPYAGELLTGLLLPLAFVLAPFIVVVLIGEVAGLSLMLPSIAYEDSDSFDAVSRSFSNVYAKPWRMAFYALVATVYGAVCYLFVRLFAFLLLGVTRGFLQAGLRDEKLLTLWPEPSFDHLFGTAVAAPETWSLGLGALLVRIWVLVVVGLMISFVLSFYFTAATIIYALMRHRVDGTPLDEIYEAPAAGQANGTSE